MANKRKGRCKKSPNRAGAINRTQKQTLLEEMPQDPMLALKKYTVDERRKKWQVLAPTLNCHGPEKTAQQWELCWSNLMSKARANPESDTYKPIMNVIRQCEASLGHDAESAKDTGRRQSSAAENNDNLRKILDHVVETGKRFLALEQQMIFPGVTRDDFCRDTDRRQSSAAENNDNLRKILDHLVETDKRLLALEQQMIGLHRDVVVVMNQLTKIVSKVA